VHERDVAEVGEELLDDGVAAVVLFGLDNELERRVGEDGVIAPGGEQLALTLRAEVLNAADDQPGSDVQGLVLRGEGGTLRPGDLGVGDPAAELVVPDGLRGI
jgi:hypothetical protein